MKFKVSRQDWLRMGKKAGWLKKAEDIQPLENQDENFGDISEVTNEGAAPVNYTMSVTYEIITPESAEDGEAAEQGFEEEDTPYDSLADMIDRLLSENLSVIFNSDGGRRESADKNTWYTTESSQDYQTGEWESKSFHPKGITDEEAKIIFDSIASGENLAESADDDYIDDESIDHDYDM
jgi:hypothetical protein